MNLNLEKIRAAASAAEGATSGTQLEEAFNRNFEKVQTALTGIDEKTLTLTDAPASSALPETQGTTGALLQTVRSCLKWLTGMFHTTTGHRHSGTDSRRVAYSDLTGTPSLPTVNNPTITLRQGGQTKGSFSLNQSAAQTVELDAGGGTGGSDITVVDSLTSTSSTAALSANQGRVLATVVEGLIQAFDTEAEAQAASTANPYKLCVY